MKIISFIALVALILTAVILNATNPSSAGPFGILAFFVCLYVLFICLTYVVFLTSERIAARFFNFKNSRNNSRNESKYKTYYYSTVISLAPVIYVGMQSMGDVGIFEILLLGVFELLACFFIHKRY